MEYFLQEGYALIVKVKKKIYYNLPRQMFWAEMNWTALKDKITCQLGKQYLYSAVSWQGPN